MPPAASDLRKQLQKLVPLTPAVFFILLVLVGGEKHGYAIMREVGILSEGKVRMGPGTLYTTIQAFAGARPEFVETLAKSQADARRRYYRLTRTGRAVLETEMGRLEALVRAWLGRGSWSFHDNEQEHANIRAGQWQGLQVLVAFLSAFSPPPLRARDGTAVSGTSPRWVGRVRLHGVSAELVPRRRRTRSHRNYRQGCCGSPWLFFYFWSHRLCTAYLSQTEPGQFQRLHPERWSRFPVASSRFMECFTNRKGRGHFRRFCTITVALLACSARTPSTRLVRSLRAAAGYSSAPTGAGKGLVHRQVLILKTKLTQRRTTAEVFLRA